MDMSETAEDTARGTGDALAALSPNPDWCSLPLFDRLSWTRLPFGDFAQNVNERVEPADAADEIYVGLEHLDPQNLHIRRWGKGSDVIGTKLRFRSGDIIFGRRRAYQRKLAVAEFDGICSAHAMVVRAKPELVLPEFLPFLMMSDRFMNRAVEISVGSLSPTINWKTLKQEEFDLPPLEVQRRIAEVLWAVDEALDEAIRMENDLADVKRTQLDATFSELLSQAVPRKIVSDCEDSVALVTVNEVLADGPSLAYGILQPGADDPEGIPMVRAIDIEDGHLSGTQILRVNKDIEKSYERTRLQGGEVLLSVMGTIGRTIVVPSEWKGWNVNRALAVIRLNTKVNNQYFYRYLRSPSMQERLNKDSIGTAQLRINLGDLRKYSLPLPSTERQKGIVAIIEAVESIEKAVRENLAQLRRISSSLLTEVFKET